MPSDSGDFPLQPGRATPEGTRRFAARFPDLRDHFRAPDRVLFSSIGLGMRRGDPGGADDLVYRSAVAQLLEGGVNVFDTALSDRMQASERNLGAALERAFREGLARRDEVIVATKGGHLTLDPDWVETRAQARRYLIETYLDSGLIDPDHLNAGVHCLDPAFLRDQIERSRRNLRLATLDLYLIEEPELLHQGRGPDEFRTLLCAAFEELERAVADGSIGAYGLSTWDGFLRPNSDRLHLSLLDIFDWVLDVGGADHHLRAVQLPFSLAMAEASRLSTQIVPPGSTGAILEALRGTGTAVLASAPLAQGRALGRLPGFVREAFPALDSDAQRCLQFVRSTPGITAAIAGMRNPDHIDENLAVARQPAVEPAVLEGLFKRATAETGRNPSPPAASDGA
jgi:aryl-alcohol dehydrogenase-like predicted oxidoreductase